MERFSRWEDRGTAYATWRVDPGIKTADIGWAGFHFCFVVEPDLPDTDAVLAGSDPGGLSRRAQSFLPPWTECFYLDIAGARPNDHITSILSRPYESGVRDAGGADINLGSRPNLMATIMEASAFADLCRSMRSRAEDYIKRSDSYTACTAKAARRAKLDEVRTSARGGDHDGRAIHQLLAAVEAPRIRLDSMGFVVLSGEPPRIAWR
jgi:ATP-dependent helicase HepA